MYSGLMTRPLSRNSLRIPVVALLLPLLALRALIPGGLMPVTGTDGSISLQLCPGTVPTLAGHAQLWRGAASAMSSHHHDGAHVPAHSHKTVCPFAALASPACTVVAPAITTAATCHSFVSSRESEQVSVATLIRTQSPRAPPRLL